MRLTIHMLLMTAISEVNIKSESEPYSYHTQEARTILAGDQITLLLAEKKEKQAVEFLLHAAAQLVCAADKLIQHRPQQQYKF